MEGVGNLLNLWPFFLTSKTQCRLINGEWGKSLKRSLLSQLKQPIIYSLIELLGPKSL
jgi:hypothetical protein